MKEKIDRIVESRETKAGLYFDYTIQVLILLSILGFTIETLPNLSPQLVDFLEDFEIFCIVIFSIEYLIRIYIARKKLKFIFSFYGIIDLVAILPFYLSFGLDLRSARVFRFLRLFRLIKLIRYNRAIRRFSIAFHMIREELIIFSVVSLILIYLSAVGIYYFENAAQPEVFSSIFSSLWWSVVTLTTVGYGDVVPITIGGRIFTFIILMIGLGIIAIPSGMISSALTEARSIEKKKNIQETTKATLPE
ncbi:ion transporter [Aquimarina hainanensis]|uniref:Ion transporter n=1 Tax=Aquimarina hainanensis TaxID=1578017 RepID=A0ABW5N594_9FLAO|nr:ion transporter [Aquimarina sp. TRL1]QKX06086.1 ion transporter [Aquimarina sp. TRL1]